MKHTLSQLLLAMILSFWLLSCGGGEKPPTAAPATVGETAVSLHTPIPPATPSPTATAVPPTPEPSPATAVATVATDTPAIPTNTPLPSDPQRIEFQAEDGVTLVGYYYPAATNPAPVIVLMHWARGDQTDWQYVGLAAWLQNRGLPIPTAPDAKPFDTPYPFPPLPENETYAVFTLDFRGYGQSEGGHSDEKHILDARAAYATAAALPGIDPQRVVGIGASIGSDAVVDGCGDTCQAALSLSPGSYLGMAYAEAVTLTDAQGKPVWCVAAEDDVTAVSTCQSASGDHYQTTIYPHGGHAMALFRQENNLQPPIESVIMEFLHLIFGTAE